MTTHRAAFLGGIVAGVLIGPPTFWLVFLSDRRIRLN